MQNYYKQFDACREREIPACSDACPFQMDILTVQDKIEKGRFNAAYKAIRDCVVFPGIVSELCPAYCENVCIRSLTDAPVQIRAMEQSVIANATRKTPNKYNLPARKKRIAVIGAGLSGMGFAFRMASKKYHVTVFEKEDRIGGQLAQKMDEATYLAEFDLQFQNETYELKTGVEITGLNGLCKDGADGETSDVAYDVIYVATGAGGETFGVPLPDETGESGGCMQIGETAVFLGGQICGKDLMHALADGINMAASAEAFLKAGTLRYPKPAEPTKCTPDQDKLVRTPAVRSENTILSEEECIAEARRCIRCQCDACATRCDLVEYYDKTPLKMRDEIFLSCKPAGSLVHKSPARKYVAACTMCGLLTESCPEHIDLCGMIKYARHKMHEADKVPAAYRQYFMRDMEFANGEYAALKRTAPDAAGTEPGTGEGYAFFPGCNLGALDPEYVIRPYRWLLEKKPDTSLLLRCCSVPVDWNGDSRLHEAEIRTLRQEWEDLGKPVLIMACISCQKHIREYLPEIETVSLYEILRQWGFEAESGCSAGAGKAGTERSENYAIFDPCSAHNETDVQLSVRALLSEADIRAQDLPKGDRNGCCGFGGMGSIAAPDFAEFVAQKKSELSQEPYIVYCSNCRDIFCDRGKKAVHVLDLLFDIDAEGMRPQPDVTRRRENRITLKKRLLKEIWKEEPEMKPYETPYTLIMEDAVWEKVNKQKILEEDLCAVIANAESTGRRTLDPQTGHYKAYKEIGYITCWVEYSPREEGYEVYNVYTHRMKIELEAVWNGRKTDSDL